MLGKLQNFAIFRNGHVAVVDLLLQAGVPVDATDNKVDLLFLFFLIIILFIRL